MKRSIDRGKHANANARCALRAKYGSARARAKRARATGDDEFHAYWLNAGVRERYAREVLLAIERELRKEGMDEAKGEDDDGLVDGRDAEVGGELAKRVERLQRVFPSDVCVGDVVWRCPEIIDMSLSEIARGVVAMKRAFPRMDVAKMISRRPRALFLPNLDDIARAVEELQREFPDVDMMNVIACEPDVIQQSLGERVEAVKSLAPETRPASLRAFYRANDGEPPVTNARLFAKVFLLVTDFISRESS